MRMCSLVNRTLLAALQGSIDVHELCMNEEVNISQSSIHRNKIRPNIENKSGFYSCCCEVVSISIEGNRIPVILLFDYQKVYDVKCKKIHDGVC